MIIYLILTELDSEGMSDNGIIINKRKCNKCGKYLILIKEKIGKYLDNLNKGNKKQNNMIIRIKDIIFEISKTDIGLL